MHITKEWLISELKKNPNRLPEWYCAINCFDDPNDFPIDFKTSKKRNNTGKQMYRDQLRRLAYTCICQILGDEATSKAWWTVHLGRTEEQWLKWYNNERLVPLSKKDGV